MSDAAVISAAISEPDIAVITPQQKSVGRIDAIDGLRALAMFMVFTYHAWEFGESPEIPLHVGPHTVLFGRLVGRFPAGVDLFMVLSGFCLFWPLVKSQKRLSEWTARPYFVRRFRRIAPPYYAAIAFVTLLPNVLVIIFRLAGKPGKWQALPPLWQFVSHILFIHTLSVKTWTGIQGAFWSLGLEMQFYIAFPLVILCYRKFGARVMLWMTLVSIIYRIAAAFVTQSMSSDSTFVATIFFLGRWMQFAAGMAAASIVASRARTGIHFSRSVSSALIAGAAGIYFFALYTIPNIRMLWYLPLSDLLVAVAFGMLIVALCASENPIRALFENRLVTWLGYISYSIFLIHQNTVYYIGEFFKRVHPLAPPMRFAVLETVGFAVIVAIAIVFFRLFEKPFVTHPKDAARAVARAN